MHDVHGYIGVTNDTGCFHLCFCIGGIWLFILVQCPVILFLGSLGYGQYIYVYQLDTVQEGGSYTYVGRKHSFVHEKLVTAFKYLLKRYIQGRGSHYDSPGHGRGNIW